MTDPTILTTEELKDLYGLDLDETKMKSAIDIGIKTFFNQVSISQFKDIKFSNNQIKIDLNPKLFPLSKTLDAEFKKDDLEFYVFDKDYEKISLLNYVDSIKVAEMPNSNILVLNLNQALQYKQAYVKYFVSPVKITDSMISLLKRYVFLLTYQSLRKDIYLLLSQKGISNWSLNGVSVSLDTGNTIAMDDVIQRELSDIYKQLVPVFTLDTTSSTDWLGFKTPFSYR